MKLGVLLFFASWQLVAQPTFEIFSAGNYRGLKDSQGDVIIPPVYDELGWSSGATQSVNQLIGYKENGKWGLINFSNKKITEPRFDKLELFSSGRFRMAFKGKFTKRYFYGLIDKKGQIILNPDYFELLYAQGAILVTTYENNQFLMGSLKLDLTSAMDIRYSKIEVFEDLLIGKNKSNTIDVFTKSGEILEEDLDKVRKDGDFLITTKGGRDGLISGKGEVIHPPIHKQIKSSGRVTTFAEWEIITENGKLEISADSVGHVGLNLWIVHRRGTSQFLSNSGTSPKGSFELKQLTNGFAVVKSISSGSWSAFDFEGGLLVKAEDSIYFNGKFFYVKNKPGWSVHNRLGVPLSAKRFDEIRPEKTRYQPVKKFDYWAVLDGIKKTLTDFRYDSISQVWGSKVLVQYVEKWGVIHIGHDWLIPPEYNNIQFVNGHFLATKGRSHHLLNIDGQLLYKTIDDIKPQHDYFILTYENKFSALNESGRPVANTIYDAVTQWGTFYELNKSYVDLVTQSRQKILTQSDKVQDVLAFSEQYFLIKKNDNFGFIDTIGNLRIANRYDSARAFAEGLAAVKLRGMWGFIDKTETLVIQPHYQWVSSFSDGIAIYQSNGHYGLLDRTGNEVLGANYLSISTTDQGNFLLRSKDKTCALANAGGIIFLSGRYENLIDMDNSMVLGVLSGKKGLLNYQGQTLVNFEYEEIEIAKENIILKK